MTHYKTDCGGPKARKVEAFAAAERLDELEILSHPVEARGSLAWARLTLEQETPATLSVLSALRAGRQSELIAHWETLVGQSPEVPALTGLVKSLWDPSGMVSVGNRLLGRSKEGHCHLEPVRC